MKQAPYSPILLGELEQQIRFRHSSQAKLSPSQGVLSAVLQNSGAWPMGILKSRSVGLMGAAFGLRSVLGFGAGAISPVVFGSVLDWTNPGVTGNGAYSVWGWAFSIFGLGGIGAWIAAIHYSRIRKAGLLSNFGGG